MLVYVHLQVMKNYLKNSHITLTLTQEVRQKYDVPVSKIYSSNLIITFVIVPVVSQDHEGHSITVLFPETEDSTSEILTGDLTDDTAGIEVVIEGSGKELFAVETPKRARKDDSVGRALHCHL